MIRPDVAVTFGCEALDPKAVATLENQWLVAVVKVRSERMIVDKIKAMGYDAFVPTQTEVHQWKDRRKLVDRIITPSHVFFNIPQTFRPRDFFSTDEVYEGYKARKLLEFRSRHLPIRKLPNVHKLLSMPASSEAAIIPEIQIKRFQYMVGMSDERVDVVPAMRKGDYVRVVRGKLKGIEGYISRDADGKSHIAIAVYPLGFAVTGISMNDVEPAKEAGASVQRK